VTAALAAGVVELLPASFEAAPRYTLQPDVVVRALGRTDYELAWRAMRTFTDARASDTQDEIWLTEHPPVYTLGLAGRREHLKRANGIPVIKVDRGGQVTYHGPGQLVAYLMFDLRRLRLGIRDMVRKIEAAVIESLRVHAIEAYGRTDAPGVYVQRGETQAKIAALGLRVRNGCTYHGLAFNVSMDLRPFSDIDPCGYPGLAVTQLADFGVRASVDEVGRDLAPRLARLLTERTGARSAPHAA
jgi:lipoyl(octanoyl) transferase